MEAVEEGLIIGKLKAGKEKWRIVREYVNDDIDSKLEKLKIWVEERNEEMKTIIGGDFNARAEREGGGEEKREEDEEEGRRPKDGKINEDGRKPMDYLEVRAWSILNGNISGDEVGEFTYVEER